MTEIPSLTAHAQSLTSSVDSWNTAMIWALVFAALAAIAVVVTTHMALRRAKQLGDVQEQLLKAKDDQLSVDLKEKDLKIAEAGLHAATAEKKAEGFRLDIAKANERAAEANLALAKFRAPRTINPEDRKKIVEMLKPFAGLQFDIALNVEPESQEFMEAIESILKEAGWVQIDWKGAAGTLAQVEFTRNNRPKCGIVAVSGIVIQSHPEKLSELRVAGLALASVLTSSGIAARAELGLGVPNGNTGAIHILVGKKPV